MITEKDLLALKLNLRDKLRRIDESVTELHKERNFLTQREIKLLERKEQILHELYTSRGGRSEMNAFSVREELAELSAKIKECRKRIEFVDKLLVILQCD